MKIQLAFGIELQKCRVLQIEGIPNVGRPKSAGCVSSPMGVQKWKNAREGTGEKKRVGNNGSLANCPGSACSTPLFVRVMETIESEGVGEMGGGRSAQNDCRHSEKMKAFQ